ncbi:MAG: recombinase RecA, partial [Saezia sp.]
GEILDLGVLHNIVDKSGAWYAYGGEKIGQGRDNSREFLKGNPSLAQEIEGKIRVALSIPGERTGEIVYSEEDSAADEEV